jgi:hypothetical protein
MNETYGRREERRVHNAGGGTQVTQQRTVSFIHERYTVIPRRKTVKPRDPYIFNREYCRRDLSSKDCFF